MNSNILFNVDLKRNKKKDDFMAYSVSKCLPEPDLISTYVGIVKIQKQLLTLLSIKPILFANATSDLPFVKNENSL